MPLQPEDGNWPWLVRRPRARRPDIQAGMPSAVELHTGCVHSGPFRLKTQSNRRLLQ
jgi:hypothetical protein